MNKAKEHGDFRHSRRLNLVASSDQREQRVLMTSAPFQSIPFYSKGHDQGWIAHQSQVHVTIFIHTLKGSYHGHYLDMRIGSGNECKSSLPLPLPQLKRLGYSSHPHLQRCRGRGLKVAVQR